MKKQLRKYVFLYENFLILAIILIPLCIDLMLGNMALDIHRYDTYGMMPVRDSIYTLIFSGTGIVYIAHLFLRVMQRRQKTVCLLHIVSTVFLIGVVLMNFYGHAPIIAFRNEAFYKWRGNYFSIWHNVYQQIFIMVQALFLVFTFFRLKGKNISMAK